MELEKVEISVPAEMVPFMLLADGETELKRNAMLLYLYIQDCTISHGKVAEILGIHKLDLITLYGGMGLAYLNDEDDDLQRDIQAIQGMWDPD